MYRRASVAIVPCFRRNDDLTGKLLGVMDYMAQNTLAAPGGSAPQPRPVLHVTPAPIRTSCTIQGALTRAGRLTIALYDTQGRQVEQVADGSRSEGPFNIEWRPKGAHPAGVYWLRASGPGLVAQSRCVLLR